MATLDWLEWPDPTPTPVFHPYLSSQPQSPLRSLGPEVRGEIDADRDAPFVGLDAIFEEGVTAEDKAAQQEDPSGTEGFATRSVRAFSRPTRMQSCARVHAHVHANMRPHIHVHSQRVHARTRARQEFVKHHQLVQRRQGKSVQVNKKSGSKSVLLQCATALGTDGSLTHSWHVACHTMATPPKGH